MFNVSPTEDGGTLMHTSISAAALATRCHSTPTKPATSCTIPRHQRASTCASLPSHPHSRLKNPQGATHCTLQTQPPLLHLCPASPAQIHEYLGDPMSTLGKKPHFLSQTMSPFPTKPYFLSQHPQAQSPCGPSPRPPIE